MQTMNLLNPWESGHLVIQQLMLCAASYHSKTNTDTLTLKANQFSQSSLLHCFILLIPCPCARLQGWKVSRKRTPSAWRTSLYYFPPTCPKKIGSSILDLHPLFVLKVACRLLRDSAESSVIETAGAWNKIQILFLILAEEASLGHIDQFSES